MINVSVDKIIFLIACFFPEFNLTDCVTDTTLTSSPGNDLKTNVEHTVYKQRLYNYMEDSDELLKSKLLKHKANKTRTSKGKSATKKTLTSSWWYPELCQSRNCDRPVTWLTTKRRMRKIKII